MIVCVDVDYREDPQARQSTRAVAGCVVLPSWGAQYPAAEHTCPIATVADYVPGQFYKRELPCVLAILELVNEPIDVVIVDGYVHLDDQGRPGMGAYLYDALDRQVAVVGVAKNPFRAQTAAVEVLRGESARPLYVTAAGLELAAAADHVRAMYGRFRFPDALKRVDRLCRDYPVFL